MVLPKKTKLDYFLEWAFRNNFLLHTASKLGFKFITRKAGFPVNWKDENALKVLSIPQSHIDAAWKWRALDTKTKKINCTFDRALMHMDMYEDKHFTYSQNQVVYYQWIKDLYPHIWEGIQKRFKDGRWEIVDGAWVESDVNVPCGESLIRQRITGNWFYLENFGYISDIAWLDDVFGFTAQLPQILAKCNCKYFLTNKFSYNDTNVWPYHTLIWRGMDNKSELLLSWNKHKNSWWQYLETFKELSPLLKENEQVVLNYMSDFDEAKQKYSEDFLPITPNVYGHGDGGHGPKPFEILLEFCWNDKNLTKSGTMMDLFNLLEPYRDRLPIWKDELYLEDHRGTLTTIHMIKENNKTSEVLLHDIEYLNLLCVLNGGKNYQPEIFELWKIMLFGEFHDVLPGTSIPEVYRDCAEDYERLYKRLFEIKDEISELVFESTKSEKITYTISNTLSWARSGIFSVKLSELLPNLLENNQFDEIDEVGFEITDKNGNKYESQIFKIPYQTVNREYSAGLTEVTGKNYLRNLDGTTQLQNYNYPPIDKQYLWILVPNLCKLKAFESRTLTFAIKKSENLPNAQNKSAEKQLCFKGDEAILLQNELLKCSINKMGSVVNINGENGASCIKSIGTELYRDEPTRAEAWNIGRNYFNKPVEMPEAEYYEVESQGSIVRSVLIKTKPSEFGTVYFYRIYLIKDCPIIYYDISTNWQEDHNLLKFSVTPKFSSEEIRSGIQYGSIKRVSVPKNRFNNYDVKYEYSNHQWSSVQGKFRENDFEVILLNRNKYGIFAMGSKMMLSLLKSTKLTGPVDVATLDDDDPRPIITDHGFNRVSVGVLCKKIENTDKQEYDWKQGYEFNFPFLTIPANKEYIKCLFTEFTCPENVFIGSIKHAEHTPLGKNPNPEVFVSSKANKKWIILRIAEYYGKSTAFNIQFNSDIEVSEVLETDMLERELESQNDSLSLDKNEQSLKISIEPYEIKTIALNIK